MNASSSLEAPDVGDESHHRKKVCRKRRKRKHKSMENNTNHARAVPSDESLQAGVIDQQVVCRGASYKDLRMDGNARVHAGDTHNSTNILGSFAEVHIHQGLGEEEMKEVETVLSALMLLAIALLMTGVHFCKTLQRAMIEMPLPKQISRQLAYLEDALGRIHEVEIGVLNWPSLHCQVMIAFEGKPGHQRIMHEKYRLFDRWESGKLIDPRHPPKFSALFKRGRHIRMSIHFESTEVRQDRCPKCKLMQRCNVDSETACKRCEFCYRGNVDDSVRITELDDEEDDDYVKQVPTNEPGLFQRISISKEKQRTFLSKHPSLPIIGVEAMNEATPNTTATKGETVDYVAPSKFTRRGTTQGFGSAALRGHWAYVRDRQTGSIRTEKLPLKKSPLFI